jgi:hypothetical protein
MNSRLMSHNEEEDLVCKLAKHGEEARVGRENSVWRFAGTRNGYLRPGLGGSRSGCLLQ